MTSYSWLKTPIGRTPLIYCDYVASGQPCSEVEDFIGSHVLPYYANTHSESSFSGRWTNGLREEARKYIAKLLGAEGGYEVLFTGSGSTAGLNLLSHLLRQRYAQAPCTVFLGPFEHHSNDLPWRETGWPIRRIPLDRRGHLDIAWLDSELSGTTTSQNIVSVAAVSNVTGLISDIDQIARVCRRYDADLIGDYAAAAPYLPLDGRLINQELDAMVWSSHKFTGGPAASGVCLVRSDWLNTKPFHHGGGTVQFVSEQRCDLSSNLARRHEAGTPNIVGDIRAGAVLKLKVEKGERVIFDRSKALGQRIRNAIGALPNAVVYGPEDGDFLPTCAFNFHVGGQLVDYALVVSLLSDLFGIQVRGGCSCAGPYAHQLLSIDTALSERIAKAIREAGSEARPGWVRLSLNEGMSDQVVDYVLSSIAKMSEFFDGLDEGALSSSVRYYQAVFGDSAHIEPLFDEFECSSQASRNILVETQARAVRWLNSVQNP